MAHALLSASSAHRWMNCPPSARLQKEFPEESSVYAEEGTLAHSIGELVNRYNFNQIKKREFTTKLNALKKDALYSEEMLDYMQDFGTYVHGCFQAAKKRSKDALVFLEERIDFSTYVEEGFGTGDVIIIADGILEIIDLKYGSGVQVYAENNEQMMLYGLGALTAYEMLYDIQTVKMTIYQPRLDNISEWEMPAEELTTWAEEFLRPTAELAYEGKGEYQSGDHCKWCKAKEVCRARADANLEMLKYDFANPDLLTAEEIAEILTKTTGLQKWAKEIEVYALEQALKGQKWNGFKLVEGRSNRTYSDEGAVKEVLTGLGKTEDEIYNKKIKGITELTKDLGKKVFESLLGGLLVKPPGKPALVPESDKRPELELPASAAEDFENVDPDSLLD